jgi:exosome complex component RRP45
MSVAALEPPLAPLNDASLLLRRLCAARRADGRALLEMRAARFGFDRADGRASCEVSLGATRVHAAVTAAVAAPFPDRPLEGSVSFFVEVLPCAAGGADFPAGGARAPAAATAVARALERQVRDARALDVEALCLLPGEAVWALRVDVRVLEDGGNVGDAAAAAAMAALLHFRLADVTLAGRALTVHPHRERVPRPLALHHTPLTVTLGVVAGAADGAAAPAPPPAPLLVLDPDAAEEAACAGAVAVAVNAHGEVCGLTKSGAAALPLAALAAAADAAAAAAAGLVAAMRAALADAEVAAAARERARHAAAQGY